MVNSNSASLVQLRRHWQILCQQIGQRISGTRGEQRAADYIEQQFKTYGLSDVMQLRFEFPNYEALTCKLNAGNGRRKEQISTVEPFMYSVNTPKRGIQGRLAYLEGGSELNFKQNLRGKVGLIIGSLSLVDRKLVDRLVKSGMAGLIAVDARVPFDWRLAIGTAPHWVAGYDLPTVGVPFMQANALVARMPLNVELRVRGRAYPAMSQNVVGEVMGSCRPDQVICVCGHHDSVAGTQGADDNASGVVFTLELARLFARRRPQRTMRFISFGTEEKLSIGAYHYMRSLSPAERRRCVLIVNADAISSRLGDDTIYVTGPPALHTLVEKHYKKRHHPARILRGVKVFGDQFPFNIFGTPSIRLLRPNIMGEGFWTLHSAHDNIDNVDACVLARTVNTTAAILEQIANASRLPFARRIPPDLAGQVRTTAKHVYRHPYSPTKFAYSMYDR